MLKAIAEAEESVALSSYIFDYDPAGIRFVEALTAAHRRGVAVRVLLDQFGELYSRRSIRRELRAAGLRAEDFMSGRLRNLPFLNLRNHRKIMVVDGRVGFIGGMNIRHGNCLTENPKSPVQDIHFQLRGPVLDQLNAVFEGDWHFATGEDLRLPPCKETAIPGASTVACVFTIGPDHEIDKLQWLLLGALSLARSRVVIMTPYFLPSETLASALMVAAMRGLDVEVLLPQRSNIFGLDWGMAAKWAPLVMHGVKVYLTKPPFDHSKVMVVDGTWVMVGSTNWDQRSLRLNFEADLETHDPALAAEMEAYAAHRRVGAHLVARREVMKTSLPLRLRNNFVRLFAPYL
jgi:cardiolipin synthase